MQFPEALETAVGNDFPADIYGRTILFFAFAAHCQQQTGNNQQKTPAHFHNAKLRLEKGDLYPNSIRFKK
jgi:hypothetical protein